MSDWNVHSELGEGIIICIPQTRKYYLEKGHEKVMNLHQKILLDTLFEKIDN